MTFHAKISASKVERMIKCPGSLALEEQMPIQPSSEAAQRGTKIHAIAEAFLTGQDLDHSQFDDDMINTAKIYVDYVMMHGVTPHVEVDLTPDLSNLHPDLGGTADAVLILKDKIKVIDLKSGRIPVIAKGNTQLMTYALGAYLKFKEHNITTFEVAIFQPGIGGSSHEYTAQELLAFSEELLAAIEKAQDPFAGFIAGPAQCKYCKAKVKCPEIKELANKVAAKEFATEDKSMNELLDIAEIVGDWAEQVKAEAKQTLASGQLIDGWQLKPGRKMVKYANQVGSEAYLAGNPLAFTIKTPAQLKKLGIELPADHFVESLSEPSLARTAKDL